MLWSHPGSCSLGNRAWYSLVANKSGGQGEKAGPPCPELAPLHAGLALCPAAPHWPPSQFHAYSHLSLANHSDVSPSVSFFSGLWSKASSPANDLTSVGERYWDSQLSWVTAFSGSGSSPPLRACWVQRDLTFSAAPFPRS